MMKDTRLRASIIRENGGSSCYFPTKSTTHDLVYHSSEVPRWSCCYHYTTPRRTVNERRENRAACVPICNLRCFLPHFPGTHTHMHVPANKSARDVHFAYGRLEREMQHGQLVLPSRRNMHFHSDEPRVSRHINSLVINTSNGNSIIAISKLSANSLLRRTFRRRCCHRWFMRN